MKLYLICNKKGKFFRAIGFGGHGGNWVELEKAKFYTKLGQAKSRVTFFGKNYPKFGLPEILEFDLCLSSANVIDNKNETINKLQGQIRALKKKHERTKEFSSSFPNYYLDKIKEIEKSIEIIKNG